MIRILLVDDQELVRAGFRVILNSEPDFEVIGEAANGLEAVTMSQQLQADVICMDVEMPVMNGIEAAEKILFDSGSSIDAHTPAILILTTFGHEAYLFEALAAGVSGFLLKTSRAEQLIDAVRALASGQALLGPDVTRAVIDRITAERDREGLLPADTSASAELHPLDVNATRQATEVVQATEAGVASPGSCSALSDARLTEREQDVIRLLAQGQSNAEIASSLFLGEATVKTHISNILQKLGVRDRIQAVVWAHMNHILDA